MTAKRHLITRLLAFGLATAMLISDQTILYAAEAGTFAEGLEQIGDTNASYSAESGP